MPYNTRRVSLSLSELGVHVPKRARAVSFPVPPASSHDTDGTDQPPNKKARCIPHFINTDGSMSPPTSIPILVKKDNVSASKGIEPTPPPSPGADAARVKVDTTGIKDEVVVGAIAQLEKTGNRPHTSKELAATLVHTVGTIETSTNPNALIQARLATYLKGPWPIVSPCPIGKQQENVHPRRVFYYLTAMPHQPIPDTSTINLARPVPRIISPALSSNSDEDAEDTYDRERSRLSPSPEVDLSSPDLEETDDIEHASMYSSRSSLTRDMSTTSLAHNSRAVSPPLESEERDFKQTANQLQAQRRDSLLRSREASETSVKLEEAEHKTKEIIIIDEPSESDEAQARRNSEEAAALFGAQGPLVASANTEFGFSSPIMKPIIAMPSIDATVSGITPIKRTEVLATDGAETLVVSIEADDEMDVWTWEAHKSPEDMDLQELEDLFDAY